MAEAIVRTTDIRQAAGGDRDAFGRLVDATRTTVCSIALSVVRDVASSEDVAQDVYLHVWQALPSLRNDASFMPWLRQLTRNRANAFLRKDRPERRKPLDDDLVAVLADPSAPADASLIAIEQRAAIREALDDLQNDAREVLILFYREERSVRQVAHLLELSESAVKKRLERARQGLKGAVEKRLSDVLTLTNPGATFSVAVLAILPPLVPVAASTGKTLLAGAGLSKAAALAGSALFSALVGVGSLAFGYRRMLLRARDERERRQIRTLAVGGILFQLALILPLPFVLERWRSLPLLVGWAVLMMSALWVQFYVFLPRITAGRLALEREEDPTAANRQRRERLVSNVSFVVGIMSAALGVWAALRT